MSISMRRHLLAGGGAGLVGGLVFAWAIGAQGMMGSAAGLLGLTLSGAGVAWHLLAAVLIGASFGAIFHYQPRSYAATISNGLLYGLLWWILGPLTLRPMLASGPSWSLVEGGAQFPSLIGHVLYGGLVGSGAYLAVSVSTPAGARPQSPRKVPRRPRLGAWSSWAAALAASARLCAWSSSTRGTRACRSHW